MLEKKRTVYFTFWRFPAALQHGVVTARDRDEARTMLSMDVSRTSRLSFPQKALE